MLVILCHQVSGMQCSLLLIGDVNFGHWVKVLFSLSNV